MPSLLVRIEEAVESSGIGGTLTDQIASLGGTGDLLRQLTTRPPAELGQMVAALDGLSLPEIEPLRALVGDLRQLSQRIPTDPTQLTGGLGQQLEQLETTLQSDLLGPLSEALDAVVAVASLVGGGSQPSANQTLTGLTGPDVLQAAAGGGGQTSIALSEIDAALDGLPSPLTVESVLPLLRDLFRELPADLVPGARVPMVSEFGHALDTILAWQGLDGAGLAASLTSTLQALAAFIRRSIVAEAQGAADAANSLDLQLQPITLRPPMAALEHGLRELAGVVTSGNLATVPARIQQLNIAVGQINTALGQVSANVLGGQSETLVRTLDALPSALDVRMRDVLSVLDPPPPVSPGGGAPDTIDSVWNQAQVDVLVADVQRSFGGLASLVDKLNIEVLREPLETVISGANTAVAELDDLLVQLTSTVSALFAEVDGFLDRLDVAAVTRAVVDALTRIRDLITQQIGALFEPVRGALAAAVDTLSSAAAAFNAAAIVDALRELLQGLTGVLDDPQVRGVFEAAQHTLDQAAAALRSLSLRPVTDTVVADIDKVTKTLEQIDPESLPDPVRGALRAAVSVLPTDFTPITQTLTARFDDLVESGPKPLLIAIQDQPRALATRIQSFSPASVVGDQLSAPYQDLVGELAAFKPSDLLEPVHQALDDLQARLQELSPAALLQPLDELHGSLTAAFANLNPTALLAPLTEQVNGVIDAVLAKIPEDAIFDAVQPVLTTIDTITTTVSVVRALLDRIRGMLEVGTPDEQLAQLIDGVLGKVDQIPDPSVLQPAFTTVRQALAATRAAQLQPQLVTPIETLVNRLDALDPARLHASVVRAYRDFPRPAVEALPPSPARDQMLAFLNGFDPLAASLVQPFTGLQDMRTLLDAERARIEDFLGGWDGLYHRPSGPLAEFDRDGLTAPQLRDLLRDAIEPEFIQPLRVVFQLLGRLQGFLAGLVAGLGSFVDSVQAQAASLALVPQAVQAIRDALHAFVDAFRALNLSFLSQRLQGVFDRVTGKLNDLDPAHIRDAVDTTFQQVIASLQLDALIPRSEIDQLDASYTQVVDTLRALDPTKLIAEVVQPEFEAAIQPLIDLASALSDLVGALLERLDGLESELDQELGRTADAFGKMLQAVPA